MRYMACLLLVVIAVNSFAETLPPLSEGMPASSVTALWKDYDSSRDPLDVQVVREWVEDGVVCQFKETI